MKVFWNKQFGLLSLICINFYESKTHDFFRDSENFFAKILLLNYLDSEQKNGLSFDNASFIFLEISFVPPTNKSVFFSKLKLMRDSGYLK